ncbi:AMP-binding protein [Sphingorhabdus sp. Alg231-15]|uniref:AMP-binding protein n=1 Tax=Sphingorhabdus sp. Alg231-15 TaxID=1922222 RepID=UPI000D55B046
MALSLTQMSAQDKAALTTIKDIERYESVPIGERISEQSIYELVCSAAETWGDAVYISFLAHGLANDEPVKLSFVETKRQVIRTANAFASLGVTRDHAVGFLVPNLPETYVCMLAASTVGRANLVNPLLSASHITNIMTAARVKAIITVSSKADPDIYAKAVEVAQSLPEPVTIVTLDAEEEGAQLYRDFIEGCEAERLVNIEPPVSTDIAGIFHTGGTTSAPKLLTMTHANQLATTCMGLLGSGYRAGDVSLAGLPSYHVIAGIATPLISLASGATILLCGPSGFRNPFMLGDFWKIIEAHHVTSAAVVPTVLSVLKDIPITSDVSSLRQIVSGAAPLSPALIEAITSIVDTEIVETYGMTEASTFCARNPAGGEKRAGSVGPFVPYQEGRIVENEDEGPHRDVAPGSVGKILLRGPNVVATTTFVNSAGIAEGEERVDADGWLDTGDLGWRDDDGYVWLQGRAKDLIIRSGHNIDPRLIEEALAAHSAVNMVAAVGQPDTYAGEVPIAYVTLNPGQSATVEELEEFARNEVSERPAAPSRIEIVETMPLTTIGKIYKPTLRLLAAATAARELLRNRLPEYAELHINAHESAPGAPRSIDIMVRGLSAGEFAEFTEQTVSGLSALNLNTHLQNGDPT